MELLQQERYVPGKWATIEPIPTNQGFTVWVFFLDFSLLGVNSPDFLLACAPERLFLLLLWQHLLRELRSLEETRDSLKAWHSTLQDPGLLWKSHVLSAVNSALRQISINHQRIQPQSDPPLLLTISREKPASEISLRFRGHPTN